MFDGSGSTGDPTGHPWASPGFDDELRRWRIIPHRLRHWAQTTPEAPFLRCASDWMTYREVDELSDRVAAGLAGEGLVKGDRVATVVPNRLETLLAFFGCAKLGLIQVPVNTFLRGRFLSYQLADAQAGVVIADEPGVRAVRSIAHDLPDLRTVFQVGGSESADERPFEELATADGPVPDVELRMTDVNAILYTSGTTGMPKGCLASHGYYLNVPRAYYACGLARPGDTFFTSWPLFHTSGQMIALMLALQGGRPIHFETEFRASTFLAIAADALAGDSTGVMIFGVGAMGMAILATPRGDGERDHRIRGASLVPLPVPAQEEFADRFGIAVYSEIYGQTECNPITANPWRDDLRRRESMGRAVPGLQVEVHDDDGRPVPPGVVGEVVVRPLEPEVMFQGYWGKPEATVEVARGLWHHTGDNAVIDPEGYLTFRDRKKDSMRRRGENVSSLELERAILEHPGVSAVVVHAVPSPLGEDDIKACVIPVDGAVIDPVELFDFFKSTLPYFAVPRYLELVEEFPVNAMGRVLKHELRARGIGEAIDFEALGLTITKSERR